jgi:hypothetical protein|tara:strand:- start:363 stop:635 length:273 start_codon:yes stop_codon:yes gene_type:complete
MNAEQIIEKATAYAKANYNNGMDMFVECYADNEWNRFIHYSEYDDKSGLMSWREVKKQMNIYRKQYAEQTADICGWGDDGNEKPNSTWWE